MRQSLLLALVAASLTACAGYRGGWTSLPYVGSEAPRFEQAPTPAQVAQYSEIALPGLNLGVSLNNQLRTYDTQVYFFVLPMSVDPRDVYQQAEKAGVTRVTLRVAPILPSFVLRHQLARFSVGGRTVHATTAHEFGMWDSNGKMTSSGGKYEYKPIPIELQLSNMGRAQLLSLEFPIDRPPPESRDVSLDLSDALVSQEAPKVPLIRFSPVRWKEGYT